jgi:hypothetical protein
MAHQPPQSPPVAQANGGTLSIRAACAGEWECYLEIIMNDEYQNAVSEAAIESIELGRLILRSNNRHVDVKKINHQCSYPKTLGDILRANPCQAYVENEVVDTTKP